LIYAKGVTPGGSDGAFFQVQLNVEPPEDVEGFLQIGDEAATPSRFYHVVIDTNFKVVP
jgi:hypothetical protein